MYGLSAPVAIVMAIGMLLLPSSPRRILQRAIQGKGPMEEYKQMATDALRKLRGRPAGDWASEKEVEDTLVSLKATYSDQEPEGSIWEVFEGPSLKAFIIGGGLVLFQQVVSLPTQLCQGFSLIFCHASKMDAAMFLSLCFPPTNLRVYLADNRPAKCFVLCSFYSTGSLSIKLILFV